MLPREHQIIIAVLGLCLAGLWVWQAGLVWRTPSVPAVPQYNYFLEVAGDLPRPGVHNFSTMPTWQEVWHAAGGRDDYLNPRQPLPNGSKVILSADRPVIPGRMSGNDLLTLGLAIDLNTAAAADLEIIPGIGSVLAERIATFRREHGSFKKVDDLLKVKGVGPKNLEKIRPYVVIMASEMRQWD